MSKKLEYLTEKTLGEWLSFIYKGYDFINNKKVPSSDISNRPDYRNEDLKIIIEFDGFRHYTEPKTILTDYKKDETYTKLGYKVIRIPYFVQISSEIIKTLFDKDIDIEQNYKHGFVDMQAALPSQFCWLGIGRFERDLDKFSCIREDIISSVKEKIIEFEGKGFSSDVVIPEPLEYLIC